MKLLGSLGTMLVLAGGIAAQTPAPRPADVASIDALMTAVYDVISGGAGEKRDWDRFRSLFAEGARLIPSGCRDGGCGHNMWTVEEYISRAGASLEATGFFEIESNRVTERYGNIAHAFSTYESRRKADDAEPFIQGINSFQLFNDGTRWWVLNIFWMDEGSAGPIPSKYLPRR